MTEWLNNLDRERVVRWTAVYLVIYVVLNACAGLAFGLIGAMSGLAGAMTASVANNTGTDLSASSTSLFAMGGLSVILGIGYIISVPLCAIAAFGLYRRKTWARMATVIALGFTVLLSLISLTNGITNIVWAAISLFALYLFWSDAGIKQVLSQ